MKTLTCILSLFDISNPGKMSKYDTAGFFNRK